MTPKFEQQAMEIASIASQTGLTLELLAERVAIKSETMRKVSKGYQKASAQLMAALRNLAASMAAAGAIAEKTIPLPWVSHKASIDPFRRVPVTSWTRAGTARDYVDLCHPVEEWGQTECKDPDSFALIIEGDSMEPNFIAGDKVVFAPNSELRNGDFVVCRLNENAGVLFKRFRRCGAEGMTVRLESLNPAYKPVEFAMNEFRFLYPAVELCRQLRR